MNQALKGIRVLDLTMNLPGPYMTWLMAEMGAMKTLKLDYETLSARFPGVIYVSITGYGQEGRYAHRAGHDLNFQALAGSFDAGGGVGKHLPMPAVPMADLAGGGLFALAGLLAAVIERGRTGKGRHVDVSMFDGTFALNVLALCHMNSAAKQKASPGHFLSGSEPFYNIYETRDGRRMALAAVEPKFWRNFCSAVNRDDLLDRQFGGDSVTREIADIFRSRTQAEWVDLFSEVDVCCNPVLTVKEAIDSRLCSERTLTCRDAGGFLALNSPIKSGSVRPRTAPAAPKLGQHTGEVFSRLDAGKLDPRRVPGN